MVFVGCDPDLHACPIAAVDETGALVWAACFKIDRDFKEAEAVIAMCSRMGKMNEALSIPGKSITALAVEAQNYYNTAQGRKVDVRDIIRLASVAGAALCALSVLSPIRTYFPDPVQWKGNVPKLAHHHRIAQRANIPQAALRQAGGKEPYLSVDPVLYATMGTSSLNPGDWKHVFDAIGLAQYAAEQFTYQATKERMLAEARGNMANGR